MSVHDQTIAKIQRSSRVTGSRVNDFIDFLLWKHRGKQWELWLESTQPMEMVEPDFCDYLRNLEDYENRLARGKIQW